MKPIDNMVAFLEDIGVIVGSEPIETDRLDAVSRWGADGRPYVLLADDKQSFARRQFDCAHELAHLMLHRSLSEGEFEENFKLIESQADRFASAFLLPAGQFPLEVDRCTLWELERLKARWRVSIKAQIVRLSRLDIINEDTATRLYKIYSAKGYAKAEPYDAAWPLQRPTLLADVFRTIIDEGQLSKAELRHDLPLLPHDVERLASLPEGWLTTETARVIDLRPAAIRDQPEFEAKQCVCGVSKTPLSSLTRLSVARVKSVRPCPAGELRAPGARGLALAVSRRKLREVYDRVSNRVDAADEESD